MPNGLTNQPTDEQTLLQGCENAKKKNDNNHINHYDSDDKTDNMVD